MIRKPLLYVTMLFVILSPVGAIKAEFLIEEEETRGPDVVIEEQKKLPHPPWIAMSIKAEMVPMVSDSVQITWEIHPSYSGDFVIGRSTSVIDTTEKALAATTINTVSTRERALVIDSGLKPGTYYYTVLSREKVVSRDIQLIKDVNYTSIGITIVAKGVSEPPRQVTGIRIQRAGKDGALVTWKKLPAGGITYILYRASEQITNVDRLRESTIRAMVIDVDNYMDQSVDTASPFYYAVTARDSDGRENTELVAGINCTQAPYYFGLETALPERVTYHPLGLASVAADGGVNLSWQYAGTTGVRYFRVFRTRDIPARLRDVREEWVIGDVDITTGTYRDLEPPEGVLYYGLVPYLSGDNRDMVLAHGVNIAPEPVTIKKPVPIVEPVPEPEPVPKPETIHPEESREIIPVPVPQKKRPADDDYTLRRILHRSFFKGHYALAIKELQLFIGKTDNEKEKARARLFIARSFIEMKEYTKALGILSREDVMEYYPDEARFWSEYALRQDR